MYCFTLVAGSEVERGIRIKNSSVPASCPGVSVGDTETFLAVSQDWFDQMINLDQKALELPALKGKQLALPTLMNTEFTEEGLVTQPTGHLKDLAKCCLVSRPGNDLDRRALVHLMRPQPQGYRATGCYKVESVSARGTGGLKVIRNYPPLDEVVGIEMVAEVAGGALFIMHPGAAFRVALPRGSEPPFVMYRLTPSGMRPNLIKLRAPDRQSRDAA
jgi:hypothetical protein